MESPPTPTLLGRTFSAIPVARQPPRPAWHLPRNVGVDFMRQLTAEKLVEKKNQRGELESVWHQIHRDNHWGDCEKMQLVNGYLLARELKPKPAFTSEPKQGSVVANRGNNWLGTPGGWGNGWAV